ncbi:MAG TPA: hypothetical protein VJR47_10000 [Stellaceae bacterium]|nr:hypothetical protein [Stellaceae bacterium]
MKVMQLAFNFEKNRDPDRRYRRSSLAARILEQRYGLSPGVAQIVCGAMGFPDEEAR